jgi:hypothetical protein
MKVTGVAKKGIGHGEGITFSGILVKSTAPGDNLPGASGPAAGLETFALGPVKLVQ